MWNIEMMLHRKNINMVDLPDEILMTIFKKLKPMEVLNSLVGVSQRLDRVACDRYFTTQEIDLTQSPMPDRFCSDILSRICYHVTWLTGEPLIIERALLAGVYPNLTSLSIRNMDRDAVSRYFNVKKNRQFVDLFAHQISQLIVKYIDEVPSSRVVCDSIFVTLPNLTKLNLISENSFSFDGSTENACSLSALIELHVKVSTLNDCLLFLDGRLPHLEIFCVEIEGERSSRWNTQTVLQSLTGVTKLRSFSLNCQIMTRVQTFNVSVLPLLRLMTNLEELTLYLRLVVSQFLTGSHLNEEIVIHLPRLLAFNFNITCMITWFSGPKVLSADIQRTFPIGRTHRFEANCSVGYFPRGTGFSQIVSIPYKFDVLNPISVVSLPETGLTNVRSLILADIDYQSFEHEFFIRISRSLPLLEQLHIHCPISQTQKGRVDITSVQFPHLRTLILTNNVHIDYIEQFLIETNTRLPNLVELQINYIGLATVTNDFTDNRGLFNCVHVTKLSLDVLFAGTTSFYAYFPALCYLSKRNQLHRIRI